MNAGKEPLSDMPESSKPGSPDGVVTFDKVTDLSLKEEVVLSAAGTTKLVPQVLQNIVNSRLARGSFHPKMLGDRRKERSNL